MAVVVAGHRQVGIEPRQVRTDCWNHSLWAGLAWPVVAAAIAIVAVGASILPADAVAPAASSAGAYTLPAVAAAAFVRERAKDQVSALRLGATCQLTLYEVY